MTENQDNKAWYRKLIEETISFFKSEDGSTPNIKTDIETAIKDIGDKPVALKVIRNAEDKRKLFVSPSEGTIVVNFAQTDSKEFELIAGLIKNSLYNDDAEILDIESNQTLESLIESEDNPQSREILDKLKGKITEADYEALRMSLYIRRCFTLGRQENVTSYREQLINKYGSRGNNISKLCSAGYFEDQIIPLVNEMTSQGDFDVQSFREIFNIFVQEEGFSVFVNNNMTASDVDIVVGLRIEKNKKYGIKRLAIHGIGYKNVKNIRAVLPNIMSRDDILKNEIKSVENIISAVFIFK